MPGKHENDDESRKDASSKDEDKKENVLPPNIDLKTSDLNKLDDGDLQMVKGNVFVILILRKSSILGIFQPNFKRFQEILDTIHS